MRCTPWLLAALALATASEAAAQTTQTYRYDANGRMIATITARPSSGTHAAYTLDDADNRTLRNNYPIAYPAAADRLASGEALMVGQQLTSQDGRFALKVQQDGNLVLWFGSTQLWASGTATGKSLYFRLLNTGVATLYDVPQNALWSSTPAAGAGASLILQNDGNLVLKNSGGSVVWQSNTCCH